MAWYTAMFERQKKMPALERILQQSEGRTERQSVDEQIVVARQITASFHRDHSE